MTDVFSRFVEQVLCQNEVDDSLFIILAAFEEWVESVQRASLTSKVEYRNRYVASRSPSQTQPVLVEVASIRGDELPNELATEFCFRMFQYHEQLKPQHIERCPPPPPSLRRANSGTVTSDIGRINAAKAKEATHAIATAAKGLPPEDSLDSFAHLAVQWARQCNLEGYDPFDSDPTGPGFHLPAAIPREDWITQYLLWSISEWFKVQL